MRRRRRGAGGDRGARSHVSPDEFKQALGRFPTGVTVLAAAWHGRHHAMTASSLVSVSLEPPLVLFCVERSATFHDVVLRAGSWGVSILAASQAEVSDRFAGRSDRSGRDFADVPHGHGPHTGAALIRGAIATLECRTWATYDGGDHTIVVGLVLAARTPAGGTLGAGTLGVGEATDAAGAAGSPEAPLAYWRGRYRSLNPTDPAPRPQNPDVPAE